MDLCFNYVGTEIVVIVIYATVVKLYEFQVIMQIKVANLYNLHIILHIFVVDQIAYYTECFKIYAELAAQLEPKETIQTDDDFEMDLHQRLCDIRALSIVVDD